MKYNKLVRDKIPHIIQGKGETCSVHVADESIEEYADVLEVLDAFKVFKQFSERDIASVKQEKREKRGGFEKRIILDEA